MFSVQPASSVLFPFNPFHASMDLVIVIFKVVVLVVLYSAKPPAGWLSNKWVRTMLKWFVRQSEADVGESGTEVEILPV